MKKYAKDFGCSRCSKQAVVFVGLNDPDATEYPMCQKCADDWKRDVIMELFKANEKKRYCELCLEEITEGNENRCSDCYDEWGDNWPDRV